MLSFPSLVSLVPDGPPCLPMIVTPISVPPHPGDGPLGRVYQEEAGAGDGPVPGLRARPGEGFFMPQALPQGDRLGTEWVNDGALPTPPLQAGLGYSPSIAGPQPSPRCSVPPTRSGPFFFGTSSSWTPLLGPTCIMVPGIRGTKVAQVPGF